MTVTKAKEKEILSTRETALLLDVSTRTIGRMAKQSVLKAYCLNGKKYFKFSEIIASIEAGKEEKKAA